MSSSFRAALEEALQSGLDHLDGLDGRPVAATATLQELRNRLYKPLNENGRDPEKVIEEMAQDAREGILGSAGGGFFGWVIGGVLPAALGADWLTSAWDQNAGLYACGPAAAVIEELAGEWLKDLLRIPGAASFALVTGCQMAHVTCLAAARNALLASRGWDVERKGLSGAPGIRVVTTSEKHGSLDRAVRLLGLGTDGVFEAGIDESGRMKPEALEDALGGLEDLVIVVLQAGDLNIGAYDDFQTLIPIAKRHDAWVHVDGAFGLWAAASPIYRHFLAGADAADSWAADGHKWLNVPYDCGYAFVADRDAHRNAMSLRASYLVHDEDARDEIDWTPEFSRRARGFATVAAIRQLGRSGIADLVNRSCLHARNIVEGIGALPGTEVLWLPRINQGLVRFLASSPGAAEQDHDRTTDEVIAQIALDGGAFFGGTTWRGMRAMRVSVSNWQTNAGHVARAIETVARVLELRNGRELLSSS